VSHVEYLRARALAYAPTFRYPLCLDEGRRAALDAATAELVRLQGEKVALDSVPPEQKHARSIGAKSPSQAIAELVAAAEDAVRAAEDAAADDMLILAWRRLDPDAYDDLLAAHRTDGRLDLVAFYPALAAACWWRAESADGEDVGLSWDDARRLLNNADRDAAHVGVLALNRAPATVPFSQRSSGAPATSSGPA